MSDWNAEQGFGERSMAREARLAELRAAVVEAAREWGERASNSGYSTGELIEAQWLLLSAVRALRDEENKR
jgi:hypothetical protein